VVSESARFRCWAKNLSLYSQSTSEANESLAELHEVVQRMEDQLRALIEHQNHTDDASNTTTVSHNENPSIPATPELHESDGNDIVGASELASSSASIRTASSASTSHRPMRNQDDAASIISTSSYFSARSFRSNRTVRSIKTSLQESLEKSRVYKRLHRREALDDSQSISGFTRASSVKGCNWSMLSNMTLGDLSVSDIAVLELPLYLSDLYDAEPYVSSKRSSRSRIHDAISSGNLFVIRTLLFVGTDIEERDRKGQTPLLHAVSREQEAIVKLLLGKGANPEARDAEGFTPFALAVRREHKAIMNLLLEKGANRDTKDAHGRTPLVHAVLLGYEAIVESLLVTVADSDLDVKDAEGLTPLTHAVLENREAIVKLLLKRGANVDILNGIGSKRDFKGRIHDAIDAGNSNVVRLLLVMGADVEERDKQGLTPVARAALENREAIVKLLLKRGANFDVLNGIGSKRDLKGRIHDAIDAGNSNVVRLLLVMGADMEERDIQGLTPVAHAVLENRENIVKLLLQKGVNLETPDAKGLTPLAHAVLKTYALLVTLLVEHGANTKKLYLNEPDLTRDLESGLHNAIVARNLKVASLLLALGADVEERNKEGLTPLVHAVLENNEHFVKLLLEKGANVDILSDIGSKRDLKGRIHDAIERGNSNVVRLLLVMGVDVDERRWDRMTPLLCACYEGKSAIAKMLVAQGADVKACDEDGATVLHRTVQGKDASLLTFLLDNGALVLIDATDNDGDTPLHRAGMWDNGLPLAQILVERGASLDKKNKKGLTPYEY
jgi:ankyrin repeat protein/uncharacterized coiled-coil protein SlyX